MSRRDESAAGSGDARAPLIVLTTAPDRDTATRIARELVERGLAACINVVGGVRSVYRWEGRIEESDEILLVAKTTEARIREFESALKELHPYEVPECVAIAPASVEAKYLAWLADATGPSRA